MVECPQHPQERFDQICTTSTCPARGVICRTCADHSHKSHLVLPLTQFLQDTQIRLDLLPLPDISEEHQLQQHVLVLLEEMKTQVSSAISRVQADTKHSFAQEIQVREVESQAHVRQKELLRQITSGGMNSHQLQTRATELLHRQQVRYAIQNLQRYREMTGFIMNNRRDILQIVQGMFDSQEKWSNLLSNQDQPMGLHKEQHHEQPMVQPKQQHYEQPMGQPMGQHYEQPKQQHLELHKDYHKKVLQGNTVSPLPHVSSSQLNSPQIIHSQLISEQSPINSHRDQSPINSQRNDIFTSPINSSKNYRSKSPIFNETPKYFPITPSKKVLQQRDLEVVVGQYTTRIDTSKNYFTQKIQTIESQKKQTITEVAYKLTQPDVTIYNNTDNNKDNSTQIVNKSTIADQTTLKSDNNNIDLLVQINKSKSERSFLFDAAALNSQQEIQRIRITENQDRIMNQQSKFQQQSSDLSSQLNQSMISVRSSANPPPIRVDKTIISQFKETRVQSFRAHEKAIKDVKLMDSDKLITCGNDNMINIWDKDKATLKMHLEGHEKAVLCIEFHKKNRIIISGSADRTVKVWRPNTTWKCVLTLLGHTDKIRSVCFITHSLVASGGDDCTVRLWNIEGVGACLFTINLETKRVVALTTNGSDLIVAAGNSIQTYETVTFKNESTVQAHDKLISALTIQRQEQQALLVTGGKDNCVKLWALPEVVLLTVLHEDYTPFSIQLSPGSGYLAVGLMGYEGEGKISIWNLRNNNISKVHEIVNNTCGCNGILFDCLSTDQKMVLWSIHENKRVEQTMLQ